MASLEYLVATRGLFQSKIPYGAYEPFEEVKMWRAVLDRALLDLLKGYEVGVDNYEEVLNWYSPIDGEFPEDFIEVCGLAGLEPDFVYAIFERSLLHQGGLHEEEKSSSKSPQGK
jgi:hypothetical protein